MVSLCSMQLMNVVFLRLIVPSVWFADHETRWSWFYRIRSIGTEIVTFGRHRINRNQVLRNRPMVRHLVYEQVLQRNAHGFVNVAIYPSNTLVSDITHFSWTHFVNIQNVGQRKFLNGWHWCRTSGQDWFTHQYSTWCRTSYHWYFTGSNGYRIWWSKTAMARANVSYALELTIL